MARLRGNLQRFRQQAVRNTVIGYFDGFYCWGTAAADRGRENDVYSSRCTEFGKDSLFLLSWALTFTSAIVSILEGLDDKPSDSLHIIQGVLLLLSILMDLGKAGIQAGILHVDRRAYLQAAQDAHVNDQMQPGELGCFNLIAPTWPTMLTTCVGATLGGVGFFAKNIGKASTVLTTIAPILSSLGETLTSERLEVESEIVKEATRRLAPHEP